MSFASSSFSCFRGVAANAKVPGLTRTHSLRYVLKNRDTNKELFVVVISLIPTEEAKKTGDAPDPKEKFEETHGKGEKKEQTTGGDDDELD